MNPLVSIIIPSFNRATLIGDTLDSIISQTYANWECIIIDDGSTDNSINILENYAKKDTRIRCYKRPNQKKKGSNTCRNYGFNLSNGEFVKFLDSDDLLSNDNIFEQLESIKKFDCYNGIVVTSQWNYFINNILGVIPLSKQNNKSYRSGYDLLSDFGIYNTFYPPHIYLTHRSVFIKSGLWNEYLKINQDGEFFTRVLLNSSRIVHSKKGMVYYRFGYNSNEVNVSSFSTREKKEHSILSWVLIEAHLRLYKNDEKDIPYIQNAKSVVLKQLDNDALKKKYAYFFRDTQNKNKSITMKFLERCLRKL